MSIEIMSEVWKFAPVDQGTLLVLLALADAAEDKTRTCYPGIGSLSEKSRLSERQVQYCIQRLREVGVITIRRNASPVKTNLYRIVEVAKWAEVRDAIIAPHGVKPETQSSTSRDEVDCVSETQLVAPKPSVTSEEPSDLFGSDEPQGTLPKMQIAASEDVSQHFDEFWSVFPTGRKTDKPKASELFRKIVSGKHKLIPKTEAAVIVSAAKSYAASKPDPQFVPMPTTWLNGARWDLWRKAIVPTHEPSAEWWGGRDL